MKIQTNAGEVELTAEMVCRGMVFSADDGASMMTIGDGSASEMDQRRAVSICERLLGCDPAVASRAACERFGVHGDAAAHGFARLRDGGAVDLRRVALPLGAVIERHYTSGDEDTTPDRHTMRGAPRPALRENERFIGLDARHASPEDVRRLCCGADGGAKEGTTGRRVVCTLAVGDHAEHEDLATGVKWSARPNPLEHLRARAEALRVGPASAALRPQEYQWVTIGDIAYREDARGNGFRVGGPYLFGVDHARPGTEVTVAVSAAMRMCGDSLAAAVESAKRAAESVRGTYSDYFGWGEPSFGASALDIMAHQDESGVFGFCAFIAGLKRWAESPAGKRATQERALVALVAAVPEGLDPIGWRSAVLALREFWATLRGAEREWPQKGDGKDFADWLLLVEHCSAGWYPTPGTAYGAGYDAYHRAIAPAPKVDRVRATWKTRGPVLPCDNGWDE